MFFTIRINSIFVLNETLLRGAFSDDGIASNTIIEGIPFRVTQALILYRTFLAFIKHVRHTITDFRRLLLLLE